MKAVEAETRRAIKPVGKPVFKRFDRPNQAPEENEIEPLAENAKHDSVVVVIPAYNEERFIGSVIL